MLAHILRMLEETRREREEFEQNNGLVKILFTYNVYFVDAVVPLGGFHPLKGAWSDLKIL